MPVVFRDSGLRYYFFSNEGFRASRATFTSEAVARTPKSGSNPRSPWQKVTALIPLSSRVS